MRSVLVFVVVAACGGPGVPVRDAPRADANEDGGLASLDPTPTTYRGTCDGSGALALSFTHFLDVDDEDQVARIYERAKPAAPVQALDLSPALGVAAGAEADLEDITRIGDTLFVTTSHGRKASGNLDRARYKLAAFALAGTPPSVTLTSAGTTSMLLDQMLVAANWDAPHAGVIAALEAASQLGDGSDPDLAPELAGANIEGLAHDGRGALLIGFRNPRPGGKAIVVSLVNPAAAVTGTARFGGAAELDLGGLGIRGMAYSAVHGAVLIVAGPHATGGPFRLYRWSGALAASPVLVADIVPPAQSAPEAVVPYPQTKDVQIVFDGGDADVGGVPCKDAADGDRVFRDAIVTVD